MTARNAGGSRADATAALPSCPSIARRDRDEGESLMLTLSICGAPRQYRRGRACATNHYGAREPAYAAAAIMSSRERLAVTVCMGKLVEPLRAFVLNPISCRKM